MEENKKTLSGLNGFKTLKVLLYILAVSTGLPQGKASDIKCAVTGVWNEGVPDSRLNGQGISNRLMHCYQPGESKGVYNVVKGLTSKDTLPHSITYRFFSNGAYREESFSKNEIQQAMKENNINDIGYLFPVPGNTDQSHNVVKRLLERKGHGNIG
ncbi:MAG: hypothetical protein OXB84_01465, partial [Halobacteriovoraceae bacterium]|nr:hypothetical protein [Halobacteriovoraceae bacterium]